MFVQAHTTHYGSEEDRALYFRGCVLTGGLSASSFLSGQGAKKCFHEQFSAFVGRLPSGGSLQFTRRVIVSDDALSDLNLKRLFGVFLWGK